MMASWMSPPGARVEDRISKLPDKVLCHILSFMPTKYVVRTSAVSRRWHNLWASVPTLDFEHRAQPCLPYLMMTKTGSSGDFFTFVDRVLSLRDQSDIRKFRLHCSCDGDDFPRIKAWIRTAISYNVFELDLRIETDCEESEEPRLELPQCIFMCKTLVALRLTSNCITCNPPASGCFQSLKVLHAKFEYPDNDSMEKFFACCPVLEHLTVEALLGLDVIVNFKVAAPELKTFRLTLPHSSSFDDGDDDDYEYSIFINCPKLEFFDLKQDVLSNYSFENAKFLVTASVDLLGHGVEILYLEPQFSTRATELLAGISNVKDLYLSAHVLEGCCVPAFDNLKKLELILDDCYNGDLLTQLLSSSPNLESLVLDHEPLDKEAICAEQRNPADKEGLESKKWKAPEIVPLCLLSHLKTISVMGFHGHLHEKEVVKYLLENGEVLHRMAIYICGFLQAEEDIYKEFSLFPRASRNCRVEFLDYKDETCRF